MNLEKILPCPFCGGKDVRFACRMSELCLSETLWSIRCYTCGAHFPNSHSQELLLAAWNMRHDASEQELEKDIITLVLRLKGEDPDTFAPETAEVLTKWLPKADEILRKT